MKEFVFLIFLALLGVVYYIVMLEQSMQQEIADLKHKLEVEIYSVKNDSSLTADAIGDKIKSNSKLFTETTDYDFTYSKPLRVDLFELGTKVIPLGRHHACFLTGINESGAPESACFITTREEPNNWRLEINNAICSVQCIDLVKVGK